MSGKSNTSLWLKFFRGAGIESGIDTKYALIFDENRIRMDMLMDLDKEILKDMGVNAMGDIIAILKHAKKVHDETKEQAVETHKPVPSSSTGAKLETTVSKVVQQNPVVSKEISMKRPEPVERKALMSQVVQKVVKVTSLGADTSPKGVSRIPDVSEKKIVVLNKRSNSDQMLREEVPVQKKIRVLPEHEGKYKIKMPEGTTPRTQKVLQSRLGPPESRTATTEKKTVFDRLGDSKVSSSTSSVVKSDSVKPVVPTKVPEVSTTKSSVFQRLGDKGKSESETAPRTASVRSLIDVESKPAQRSLVSRVDPRVYAEKTLRTIPSKISVPAMSSGISQRLKSEVTTASPSSSSRIISSKSSVSSSGSRLSGEYRNRASEGILARKEGSRSESSLGRQETASAADARRILNSSRGEVVQTIRLPSKNQGKYIVKRLIYKKVPKSSLAAAKGEADYLPDISDPLADYFDSDD